RHPDVHREPPKCARDGSHDATNPLAAAQNTAQAENHGPVASNVMPDYQAPKGMRDVLAPESSRWAAVVATFAEHARRAGFGLALTPLIEHLEVFERVGDSTDIVRKEMYDFTDKGGRRVAVRPEITAGLMRAYAEHRPPVPWKAWTVGPNFRYEAPQAGRFRQHFQL